MATFLEVQRRLAEHYLGVLRELADLYQQGGENIEKALSQFDQDIGQIRPRQEWAVTHTEQDPTALRLCSAYPAVGIALLNARLNPRERLRWLEPALAAARRLHDRAAEGSHLAHLGHAYQALGETSRAIVFYEQALTIACEIDDPRSAGAVLDSLGTANAAMGNAPLALQYHEQALNIAREIGNLQGEESALVGLGQAYAALGDPRRAIDCYIQALPIVRAIGNRLGESSVLGSLGLAYARLGEFDRARQYYDQCLAIARTLGDRRSEAQAQGNIGIAFRNLGAIRKNSSDIHRSIDCFERQLLITREVSDPWGESNAFNGLGSAYFLLGEPDRAIEYYGQARCTARQIGYRQAESNALGNLGLVHARMDEFEQAVAYYEQALTLARTTGDRRNEAHSLFNMSLSLDKLDQRFQATAHAKAALEIYERSGDNQNAIKVRTQLGAWREQPAEAMRIPSHYTITERHKGLTTREKKGSAMGIFDWLFGKKQTRAKRKTARERADLAFDQLTGIAGRATAISAKGHPVCPNCGQEFPVSAKVMRAQSDGIPTFMCPGCGEMIRLDDQS